MFMKKILMILFSVIFVLAVCGCNNEQVQNEPKDQQTEVVKHEEKLVGNNPPADVSGFEPLGKYEYDIDGDGNLDAVTLYTSAQRDKRGDLMWDDSQVWILQAELNGRPHTLFSGRFNGRVYMNVADYYNQGDEEIVITLIIDTNASHEIREYRYDENLDGALFKEKTVFTTNDIANQGIGNRYSSIPDYE